MNVLLLSMMIWGVTPGVEIQTLSGETLSGQITQLDAKSVTIETTDGSRTLLTDRLAGLVPLGVREVDKKPGLWVELVDGSMLPATQYTSHEGKARIATDADKPFEVSTRFIKTVRFQVNTPDIAASWSKLIEKSNDTDLLVIRKADAIDFHQGIIRDVTESSVQFDLDGDLLPVKLSKVHGLIFFRPPKSNLPEPTCRITGTDGSSWQVRSLSVEESTLRWTTLTGLEVSREIGETTRIDFSNGKIVYLSDLKPESVRWTPYLGVRDTPEVLEQFFRPRPDRSMSTRPLQLEGITYRKGLSIHSRTELVYRLPDRFRRFKALAGIDDHFRPLGDVRLEIRGDDRVLSETVLRGIGPALPIDIDLTGVRRLTLLVDYGEQFDVGDHLDLCEARMLK